MNSFLSQVAVDLFKQFGDDISKLTLILPNRRSAQIIQAEIGLQSKKPIWSPAINSINDWILSLNDFALATELDALTSLYLAVQSHWSKVGDFTDFLEWGEIIIRDFEELDKNLISPDELYSFLSDSREIELRFSMLEDEEIILMKKFWRSFSEGASSMQKEWLELWKVMPAIYNDFIQLLEKENLATAGHQYRLAVNKLIHEPEPVSNGPIHVFVGFNALSQAEETIFDHFSQIQKGLYYWDVPAYLMSSSHPAGKLPRKYIKRFPAPTSFRLMSQTEPTRFESDAGGLFSSIKVYGFDTAVGQVKQVADWLIQIYRDVDKASNLPTTGIILGDESVSEELLLAIRNNQQRVNSSIGTPVIQSSVAKGIIEFLQDPELEMKGLFNALVELTAELAEKEENSDGLEFKCLATILEELIAMKNALGRIERGITVGDWTYWLKRRLSVLKVPESRIDHPTIQVSGILESRVLDYDHLILLSVNEGIWPAKRPVVSLIPYHIRLKYQLPVRETQDAIYGFHFFRLLQRSKSIHIGHIGPRAANKVGVGERSRFIQQLEFDLGWTIKKIQVVGGVQGRVNTDFSVSKSQKIADALRSFCENGDTGRVLSPSAINLFLDCPLKFAYQYIFRIHDRSLVNDPADPRIFGLVLHGVMEVLYKEADSNTVSGEYCQHLLNQSSQLRGIIREVLLKTRNEALGPKDDLVIEVLLHYVKLILSTDKDYAPFQILSVEGRSECQIPIITDGGTLTVRLGGIIDRIDKKEGVLRIVDYKTGNPKMRITDWSQLVSQEVVKRPKEILQTLLYCWIYSREHELSGNIKPVLYSLRSVEQGILRPALFYQNEELQHTDQYAGYVGEIVNQVLIKIFQSDQGFQATDEVKTCTYCEFKTLCNR